MTKDPLKDLTTYSNSYCNERVAQYTWVFNVRKKVFRDSY